MVDYRHPRLLHDRGAAARVREHGGAGRVRSLGVSNDGPHHLAQLERDAADVFAFALGQADLDALTTDEYSSCAWDPAVEPLGR
ncbi:hypothetical protein CDD83_5987 [Cordyceps sp. RAO-2017]|nr:hypothetical protein CDD83_5987 [Cordyceps sp. RAO-2017]